MNIRTKALIETTKVIGAGLLGGLVMNLMIEFLGFRIAAVTLVSILLIWFSWIVYNMNLRKLESEEILSKYK